MKFVMILLAFAILAQAKTAPSAATTDKVVIEKNVKVDTTKVVLHDTLVSVKYDTIKVFNTFKDTIKFVKSDTVRTKRVDTLWTKKYSRSK
jgi:hypothetical protein